MIIGAEQRESNTATTETDQAQKKKKRGLICCTVFSRQTSTPRNGLARGAYISIASSSGSTNFWKLVWFLVLGYLGRAASKLTPVATSPAQPALRAAASSDRRAGRRSSSLCRHRPMLPDEAFRPPPQLWGSS